MVEKSVKKSLKHCSSFENTSILLALRKTCSEHIFERIRMSFQPKLATFFDSSDRHHWLVKGKALTRADNLILHSFLFSLRDRSSFRFELSDEKVIPAAETIVRQCQIAFELGVVDVLLCKGRQPSIGFIFIHVFQRLFAFEHFIVVHKHVSDGDVNRLLGEEVSTILGLHEFRANCVDGTTDQGK